MQRDENETVAVYSEADKDALHTQLAERSNLYRTGSVQRAI